MSLLISLELCYTYISLGYNQLATVDYSNIVTLSILREMVHYLEKVKKAIENDNIDIILNSDIEDHCRYIVAYLSKAVHNDTHHHDIQCIITIAKCHIKMALHQVRFYKINVDPKLLSYMELVEVVLTQLRL